MYMYLYNTCTYSHVHVLHMHEIGSFKYPLSQFINNECKYGCCKQKPRYSPYIGIIHNLCMFGIPYLYVDGPSILVLLY